MDKGRVLWLDNDQGTIKPYLDVLRAAGFVVSAVAALAEADAVIRSERFDLVIIDVMIPTQSDGEEANYPKTETNGGLQSGLAFYKTHRATLVHNKCKVLILTVRMDREIRDLFIGVGLAPESFERKAALADAEVFLARVNALLGS